MIESLLIKLLLFSAFKLLLLLLFSKFNSFLIITERVGTGIILSFFSRFFLLLELLSLFILFCSSFNRFILSVKAILSTIF